VRRHDGRVAQAVCILFDAEGERVIRGLWARLESRGIPTPLTHTHGRHHPHLSLARARTWYLDAGLASVAALPPALPVHLACQRIVAFPRGRAALAAAAVRHSWTAARARPGRSRLSSEPSSDWDLSRHQQHHSEESHLLPHVLQTFEAAARGARERRRDGYHWTPSTCWTRVSRVSDMRWEYMGKRGEELVSFHG
jgi:hypothetical protein